jgi:hypothetical protein
MNDHRDTLRRRVAYYRRRLAEGVDAAIAQEYLRQILEAESELGEIEKDTDRRE